MSKPDFNTEMVGVALVGILTIVVMLVILDMLGRL